MCTYLFIPTRKVFNTGLVIGGLIVGIVVTPLTEMIPKVKASVTEKVHVYMVYVHVHCVHIKSISLIHV